MGKTTKKNQFIREKEDSCTLGKGHSELIICPIDYILKTPPQACF